jgi:tRNA (guanine-N7-)-methyltransferase
VLVTDSPENKEHRRSVRSFVMRSGRVTTGQARALQKLGAQFILPY